MTIRKKPTDFPEETNQLTRLLVDLEEEVDQYLREVPARIAVALHNIFVFSTNPAYNERQFEELLRKFRIKNDLDYHDDQILSVLIRGYVKEKVKRIVPETLSIQKYVIRFTHNDKSNEADVIINPATDRLVDTLTIWWESISFKSGINPLEEPFSRIGYHLMELSKNALEYGEGNKESCIEVSFHENFIEIMVTDGGRGFEDDPNDIIEKIPDHGLGVSIAYSDEFSLESHGKKYEKREKIIDDRPLKENGTSPVMCGTKVTFKKRFKD